VNVGSHSEPLEVPLKKEPIPPENCSDPIQQTQALFVPKMHRRPEPKKIIQFPLPIDVSTVYVFFVLAMRLSCRR